MEPDKAVIALDRALEELRRLIDSADETPLGKIEDLLNSIGRQTADAERAFAKLKARHDASLNMFEAV